MKSRIIASILVLLGFWGAIQLINFDNKTNNVNSKDISDKTALEHLCLSKQFNVNIAEMLIKHGAEFPLDKLLPPSNLQILKSLLIS